MTTFLIILAVAWVLIGLAVYAMTDTSGAASRMERTLFVIPLGIINEYMFFFVVALWPIWLVVQGREN